MSTGSSAPDLGTSVDASPPPAASAAGGEASAALAHIAASGATLTELGTIHGVRSVFARSGDQFMVFQVAPDGQATVAGLMTDISVDQLRSITGKSLTELARQHGLRSFFLRNGAKFQVFYATPDGQRLIPGVMWDASGHDITKDQVGTIPGTVPTLTIGKQANAVSSLTSAPTDAVAPLLAAIQTTAYGPIGSPTAPQLWMFVDPQCAYSVRAMQALKPFVDAGRVRLNVIPLSILDGEDNGLSTKAALSLVSMPAADMVPTWISGQVPGDPAADAAPKLQANMQAAAAAQLKGTPTFVWQKPDGTEGRLDGMPTDVAALLASIGSPS